MAIRDAGAALALLLLPTMTTMMVVGQGPGNGISKYTTAVTDAYASGDWLMKYLPVVEAFDDCVNRTCQCGTQGRVSLILPPDVEGRRRLDEGPPGGGGGQPGFGIHTVWAPAINDTRANANGGLTVAQVEEIWTQGVGALSGTAPLTPNQAGWTDNHVSFHAPNGLDFFVNEFKAGAENYRTSQANGTYSVM